MAMRVEIIERDSIKPSSPTPLDLKVLKLSVLDQLIPAAYVPVVLFYPECVDQDQYATATERSHLLKTSLSETLTHFYPLAGRFKDNAFIECEDEGVVYIEARIRCLLSEFLEKPDPDMLKKLLPVAAESKEVVTGSQLQVQASFFDCGGMAIGVCASHKIVDGETLTTFIKCWSAVALGSSPVASRPVFMGATIFPQRGLSFSTQQVELIRQECVNKRFVFDASKVSLLRAKVASQSVPEPTRVEAVSALLWKCAMNSSISDPELPRKSVWSLSLNLRKRLAPPVPGNHAGNCISSVLVKAEDEEIELKSLVGLIRKAIQEFGESYARKLQENGATQTICEHAEEYGKLARSNKHFYYSTSWCKFDLYNNADFGWGKPVWFTSVGSTVKNSFLLMDARDGGGIETWVRLSEDKMALFESNKELLEFSDNNPKIKIP